MRRIGLLAVHQGGGLGGAPVSMVKLLAELDTTFEPHVVFTESGAMLDYAQRADVPARVVSTGGAFFASAHARLEPRMLGRFVRTFPSAVHRARGLIRDQRPDVLHLNTSVLLAWAAAARHERVPVVWVIREVLHPRPSVRRWQAGYILRHSRRVVVTSDAVAASFPPSAGVRRVHNAVDLREFSPELLTQAAAVRAELGVEPRARVVAMIGSVQRPKGHWLMLDALDRLRDEPDLKLVLVGGGVGAAYASTLRGRAKQVLGRPLDNLDALLREARQRGLAERILVTGFRADVARVLVAADVVVFPSLAAEGFGRPIIEAMAMQRPVVATDIGPSREILGEGAGLLVPPRADAVAAALRRVLSDRELRQRMGRAGRARVEALFSLDRQVEAMAAIYREAAIGA